MENVKKKVKNKLAEMLFSPITYQQIPNANYEMAIGFYPSMNLFEPSMIREVKKK